MKKLHNKPKSSIKLFHTNKFRGKEEKVFCRKRLSPTNKTPNDAEKKSREFTWLFSLLFMNILYELERISPNYAFFSGNLILIILRSSSRPSSRPSSIFSYPYCSTALFWLNNAVIILITSFSRSSR